MDDNPLLEPIPVLRTHLQAIADVLDRAYALSSAEDMVTHYRNNKGNSPQASPMTSSLGRAFSRIQGYLGETDESL